MHIYEAGEVSGNACLTQDEASSHRRDMFDVIH